MVRTSVSNLQVVVCFCPVSTYWNAGRHRENEIFLSVTLNINHITKRTKIYFSFRYLQTVRICRCYHWMHFHHKEPELCCNKKKIGFIRLFFSINLKHLMEMQSYNLYCSFNTLPIHRSLFGLIWRYVCQLGSINLSDIIQTDINFIIFWFIQLDVIAWSFNLYMIIVPNNTVICSNSFKGYISVNLR